MRYKNNYYGYRSEAYHMDGGANDEGYNHRYCSACSGTTEHDLSTCIPCGDKAALASMRRRQASLKKK